MSFKTQVYGALGKFTKVVGGIWSRYNGQGWSRTARTCPALASTGSAKPVRRG